MARYRVKELSFIENKLVEEGKIIEFSGTPGDNLELVNDNAGAPGVEANGGFYQPQSAADLA
jgi:hypothetical protein